MSIETELTSLREAIDRLTAAVTGHAETRLSLFNRAGQEALEAIPLLPGEDPSVALNFLAVPFTNPAPTQTPATAPKLDTFSDREAANQPADEPPRIVITYDEARELGKALIKTGKKADLQDILVNRLGAGSLDQLTAAQRVTFASLVNGILKAAA